MAKPTMLAQQPATAAPPASPTRLKLWQMAAEEMGSVSAMPTDAGDDYAHPEGLEHRRALDERAE